ncbi:MAG TPA: DUF1569 domain-containing protein [Gemmatimonadales bacterium]|nr:DUF1569 domain-containing protein [Gemmatimonadales bacterium]
MMPAAFKTLPELVLGPLAGRPDADWYRAPAGKWNSAQIVEHLSISLEGSSRGFESRRDKPAMQRRPRTGFELLSSFAILGVRWFPPGRKSPPGARPPEHVDRSHAEAHFREGFERFLRLAPELLPARSKDLFVKHPVLGDLTLPEWLRFHVIHCRHHAAQIRSRVAG